MIKHGDPHLSVTKKLVAVISDKLTPGVAMNTVAHMALGMGSILGPESGLMCDYVDASGTHHPSISAYPFIILSGRPNKIREAVELAKNAGITTNDFVNTMTVGTYDEQLEKTKNTPYNDLEFYGATFFGDFAAVHEITRKFSLFK